MNRLIEIFLLFVYNLTLIFGICYFVYEKNASAWLFLLVLFGGSWNREEKKMNHDQFTYWLQGFVEMNGGKEPTKAQWQMIKDHLQLCFKKVTPPYAVGGSFGGDLKLCSGSYGADTLFKGGGDGYKRNNGGGAC